VLIDELVLRHPVDVRRVYVTGMSNGGMMTHRLGRELSGKIAAIAPLRTSISADTFASSNALRRMSFDVASF
jgi:polyhydroxybutyrate depolymerase